MVSAMICPRCAGGLPDLADMRYCPFCGRKLVTERGGRKRDSGQGTVYKLPNGKYRATVVLRTWVDGEGKRHRQTRSRSFSKRKDAVAAVASMLAAAPPPKSATFSQVYERWYPTHTAGADTMGCYRAAYKHFAALTSLAFPDIDVDDLQECIDACPRGRRTKENMRALVSLLYKYAVPRHLTRDALNLGSYLTVSGDGPVPRESFDARQLERIRRSVGVVTGAEEIYCMCYLGFRPSEFLALTSADFDKMRSCLVGGSKTAAGRGRTVTVSPKILPYIQARAASPGPLFTAPDGEAWDLRRYTEDSFYPALERIGIPNPMIDLGGGIQRHKYTPHSCRHTFATLLKRVSGADKDKLELIGHTSTEMLRYYQDVSVEDLRSITDAL